MLKIAFLGSKHTAGGSTKHYDEFSDTLPGVLSNYLSDKNVENYVYNGGQPSFSIATYPLKILSFYKEYQPDMFIIELPTYDKFDLEISGAVTGRYLEKEKDYHPIYSLQRVQTKDWVKGPTENFNRVSINTAESLDIFHNGIRDDYIKKHFKGHLTGTIHNYFEEDTDMSFANNKIIKLKKVLDNESYESLKSYIYFRSMFLHESTTDYSNYLNNVVNIINTCKAFGIKLLLWNMNRFTAMDSDIYKSQYEHIINDPSIWVEDIHWTFKNYAKQNAIFRKKDYGPYFTKEAWKIFVNKILGKRVLDFK